MPANWQRVDGSIFTSFQLGGILMAGLTKSGVIEGPLIKCMVEAFQTSEDQKSRLGVRVT